MATDVTAVRRLLDEARQLSDKATPAPWEVETQPGGFYDEYRYITGHVTAKAHTYAGNAISRRDSVTAEGSMIQHDAEFIARSRSLLPALVKAVAEILERAEHATLLRDAVLRERSVVGATANVPAESVISVLTRHLSPLAPEVPADA